MSVSERDPQSNPQGTYVLLAISSSICAALGVAIDSFILYKWVIYPADWLVASLAYLVMAYVWLVPINFILSKPLARTGTNPYPTGFNRGASRNVQIWTIASGLLGTAQSIPYLWALNCFNPSAVYPFLAIYILYLVLWDGPITSCLVRYPSRFRWLVLNRQVIRLREVWVPTLTVIVGSMVASIKQVDFLRFGKVSMEKSSSG
jgi:hypothetical protein